MKFSAQFRSFCSCTTNRFLISILKITEHLCSSCNKFISILKWSDCVYGFYSVYNFKKEHSGENLNCRTNPFISVRYWTQCQRLAYCIEWSEYVDTFSIFLPEDGNTRVLKICFLLKARPTFRVSPWMWTVSTLTLCSRG